MKDLLLHVHNDLDYMFRNTKIPMALNDGRSQCYIMQQNRIVYVGTCEFAEKFIKLNKDKFLKGI